MGLKELVEISNYYGVDEEIVLAGGGNTSYKNNEFLYIKASGTTLATISQDGFVKMNRSKLAKMWEVEYSDDTKIREEQVLEDLMNARETTEHAKRPSVETTLHDLFSQKYVVHTHPALVNGLTCSNQGEKFSKEIFGDDVIWIPATMPGYVLSKVVKSKISEYEVNTGNTANLLLLENHGIFVAGNSLEEIKKIMNDVMNKLKANIRETPDFSPVISNDGYKAIAQQITKAIGDNAKEVIYVVNAEVSKLTMDEEAFRVVNYAYTPDHMVYYKHTPLFVKTGDDIAEQVEKYKEKFGFFPKAIAIQGVGVFACGSDNKQADIVRLLFIDAVKIAVYSKSFGGGKYMPKWLVDFINDWEVEAYRRNVSQSGVEYK